MVVLQMFGICKPLHCIYIGGPIQSACELIESWFPKKVGLQSRLCKYCFKYCMTLVDADQISETDYQIRWRVRATNLPEVEAA